MKLLVIGLCGVSPELLLRPDELPSIGRLMEIGRHGSVGGANPPSPVPSWLCMVTSRNPGSLGVDGSSRDGSAPAVGFPTIADQVTAAGGRAAVLSLPGATAGGATFDRLLERIGAGDWDYLHFVDEDVARLAAGPPPDESTLLAALERFDEHLGRSLEALDGDTAVLVVSLQGATGHAHHDSRGAYVLAGPGVEPVCEGAPADLVDLAPTLLELGGYEVPASMQGKSLLFRGDSATAGAATAADEEAMIRDHLRGLGYL